MIALAEPEDRDDVEPLESVDEAGRVALATIVAGISPGTSPTDGRPPPRWAWISVAALLAAGHSAATLAELESRGLVVFWSTPEDTRPESERSVNDPPCGVVTTLTPWAAQLLAVEIVEEGLVERPRWGGIGTAPKFVLSPYFRRFYSLEFPEEIVDPGPSPEEYLLDEHTGKPVLLLGVPVVRDRRIKAPKATPPPRRTRARAT